MARVRASFSSAVRTRGAFFWRASRAFSPSADAADADLERLHHRA
jgi:hypothetical protein